ncbi:MAG: hypothetical protein HY331_03620, partial [Chloroflexi bacterium]|nr:hypothetical protein [Chloroflexota bacterium]
MELLQYWKVIRHRFWVILLLNFVGVLSALWYTSIQPPVFTATAVLMLNPAVPLRTINFLTPAETEATVANLAATYVRYMQTRAFALLVADRLGGAIPATAIPGTISARAVPGTRFFEITAVSRQADVAAALANTAADIFISQNPQERPDRNADTVKRLTDQQLYWEGKIRDLQTQLETFQAQPQTPQVQAQIERIETQFLAAQETLVRILETLANLQSGPQTSAVLIDTALPAGRAQFANRTQNVLFAVLASSGLAIALVFLLEYLDTAVTIRKPDEIDQILAVPLLGVVGVLSRVVTERDRLVTVSHPKSPNAEAFHSISANLKLSRTGSTVRSLLVTSPGPSEGKTLTAVNLA